MLKNIWIAIFGLFSENSKTLSVGRIAFWIAFAISCAIWLSIPPIDVPEYLFYFLMLLLVYNTCKKVIYILAPVIASKFSRANHSKRKSTDKGEE